MFGWKQTSAMNPVKVVLLACGSYNPPTIMHLRMFEIARDALNKTGRFQVVGGYVSPVSDGYKKKDLLPAKHRCAMLKAALRTSDWIKLDTWECEQSSWTETAKVLRHFRQLMDNQYNVLSNVKPSPKKRKKQQVSDLSHNKVPRVEVEDDPAPLVRFLCGADLLESFSVPGLWADDDVEAIVKNYGLVVINREGSNASKFIYESDVLSKYKENIILVNEWLSLDISSTKIRRACRRGESLKYVVQDAVIDYIQEHRLYGLPDKTFHADFVFTESSDTTRLLLASPDDLVVVSDFCGLGTGEVILCKFINHMMPSPNGDTANTKPPSSEDNGESTNTYNNNSNNNNNNAQGEISVVLRSAQNGGGGGGYSGRHVPAHRMTLSPKKAENNGSARVACMTDIGTLVRRMKNVRVGFTPETCV